MTSMTIAIEDDGALIKIAGPLTEEADYTPALDGAASTVRVDLSGIVRVTSLGVRDWVLFLRALCADRTVTLERCSSLMVRQFGMVPSTLGEASVSTIMLPFFCEGCDDDREVLYEVTGSPPTEPPEATCPTCGEAMDFDDVPDAYFSFLDAQHGELLSGASG